MIRQHVFGVDLDLGDVETIETIETTFSVVEHACIWRKRVRQRSRHS
jgi:hypothetical protein